MGRGTTLGVYLKAISSSGSLLLLLLLPLLLLHFQEGIIVGASSSTSSASAASVVALTEQKCDKMVAVESVGIHNYLGNVTFVVPTPSSGRWTTVIKFTSPYTFIGGWGVEVQSFGLKAYAIFTKFKETNLKAGDLVIFQFRVYYGLYAKTPKVLSIKWENNTICGPPIKLLEAKPPTPLEMIGPIELKSSEEEADEVNHESREEDQGENESTAESDEYEEIQQRIATNNVRL